MGKIKVYTHNPNGPLSKNHKIVIAAYQKGLTNIKVSWHPATSYAVRNGGWLLECDQVPWYRLGLEISVAVNKINSWTWDGKPSEGGKLKY